MRPNMMRVRGVDEGAHVLFDPVPLPSWMPGGERAAIRRDIGRWVDSAAMRALVGLSGGAWPTGDTGEILSDLDAFSAATWDFRRGRERVAIPVRQFDDGVRTRIGAAVTALGLAGRNRPAADHYDHVLILGGMVRGCVARSAFTADLGRHDVKLPNVYGLGSFRPTTDQEHASAGLLGLPFCRTEFDAMDGAVRLAFDLTHALSESASKTTGNDGHVIRRYRSIGHQSVTVVAAPSSEPATRRANTADTYRFWGTAVADVQPGEQVLLVTTDLYVPFQHCDAIRVIGMAHDVGVDTVGVDVSTLADPELRQVFGAQNHLQELRSAIVSMNLLYRVL